MAKLDSESKEKVSSQSSLFDLGSVVRPPWLGVRSDGEKSNLEDDVWYLGDPLPAAASSSGTLSWNLGIEDSINPTRSKYWVALAKTVGYFYMESCHGKSFRTSSLATTGRELSRLCSWLHVIRKRKTILSVSPSDVTAFEDYLSQQNISQSHVETRLTSFVYLHRFKDEVGGGLSFIPYLKPGSLKAAAKRIGKPNGHTDTLKPRVLFQVLDTALGVIERGDEILGFFDIFLEMRDLYCASTRSRKFKEVTGKPALEFRSELRLLYGSALVIIFAFLGDRKHQVGGLKTSDVKALIQGDTDELVGNVRKTSPSLAGTETSAAVTPPVRKALEFILKLTEKTRDDYGGELLLVTLPIGYCSNTKPNYVLDSQSIYSLLGYVGREAGVADKLLPHMFRKAYSMIWTWRFELGDMYWLSQVLHHSDPEYTRVYTEDEDVWKYLPDDVKEFTHDVMLNALTGEDSLYGGASKALKRYRKLLYSKISVLMPEQLSNFIEELRRRHKIRIVPWEGGYCFMSEIRGVNAKCSLDGKWPDYSRQDEKYCVSCANFGVRTKNRKHWEECSNAHVRVRDSTDIEILKTASEEGIKRAQKVINWIDTGSKEAA